MWSELDRLHLVVGYLAPFFVPRRVEFALHFEPSLGRRCRNELHHSLVRAQWFSPPVYGDEREQPMLDLIPLAGARGKVAYGDRDPEFVSEALQLELP